VTPSAIDLSLIAPAFVAGLLVLATHVPLGAQVLKRGIVFIDLAIAQIAALGVIAATMFDADPGGLVVQIAAATAALLGAVLLTWTEKRWPKVQEAQIGTLFVLAATGGILLLARNPHGGEHLRDLLAGQILWVGYSQLVVPAIGTAVLLVVLALLGQRIAQLAFYVVFALAVTMSVQLVGVYLVFASLIIPSLATRNRREAVRLPIAFAVGAGGYAIGLTLSSMFDLPAGALIVWCLAALAIAAYAPGPADSR
jgi:zinc/manganese transport system permease protein